MDLSLGIDFGTSGARAIVLDSEGVIRSQIQSCFTNPKNLANQWKTTLWQLLSALPIEHRSRLGHIAINGTSSTVLLCDRVGNPIVEPLLYNDARGATVLDQIRSITTHPTVIGATSSLAKLLWWQQHCENFSEARYFLHQADWLAFLLHGALGISDYHNSLKLGYDVEQLRYPDWMPLQDLLPQVRTPGSAIASVQPTIATQFDLPRECQLHAGTTDSIAAFMAAQATRSGEAVTSLGSTIVLKLLSETRIENAQYGIYSHRFGNSQTDPSKPRWLVGGASNTGGAVLRQFFSDAELIQLSAQIAIDQESPLDYYPLLQPGERFPINDPTLAPRLNPRPENPVEFLHGLLESMARIEANGYHLLESLGADRLTQVFSAGGGAANSAWTAIRQRQIGVLVKIAPQTEAAYGTALLAMRGM